MFRLRWFDFVALVINGSCGSYGSCLAWGLPFPDCVGGLVACVQSPELNARARLTFRGLSCW